MAARTQPPLAASVIRIYTASLYGGHASGRASESSRAGLHVGVTSVAVLISSALAKRLSFGGRLRAAPRRTRPGA